MEIIKAIKRFFCEYRVIVTFKSYAKETEKDGACIQFLPSINFWWKRYDPAYTNGFFIGWLVCGIAIDFVGTHHLTKEEE